MTREIIEKLIDKRNKELEEPYIPPMPFEQCKKFIDENPYNNIKDFLKIDIWEMVNCIFAIENPETAIESKYLISLVKSFIDEYEIDSISTVMDKLSILNNAEVLPIAIDYILAEDLDKEKNILKDLKNSLKENIENLKSDPKKMKELEEEFKEGDSKKTADDNIKLATNETFKECRNIISYLKEEVPPEDIPSIIALAKLFIIDSKTICEVLALKIAHQKIIDDRKMAIELIEEKEAKYGIKYKNKEKEKAISIASKKLYNLDETKELYYKISKYVHEELNTIRKTKKAANKETAGYKVTLAALDRALKQEEIKNPQTIINTATSEEIKKAILKLIYEHNMKYYKRLEEELTELRKNTKNHYIYLLNDYNIQISESDLNKIMINKVSDLKEILNVITMIGIKENIVEILKNTNVSITNRIRDLVENNYLSKPYIIKNPDIFTKESKKIDKIENGILIISSYNINPVIFLNHSEILVDNQENLIKNLEILKSYNLLKNIKNTSDFTFLTQTNIENKIDKFLELGYEKCLEDDISLLNTNNIKRLDILKVLNMADQSKEELEKVLNSEKFFIRNDDISDYIPNITKYKEPVKIPSIDLVSFRNTGRTYEIGSNLFSIQKILRLLSTGNDLYTSIFSGVNLTEEEYNDVLKALNCYETTK